MYRTRFGVLSRVVCCDKIVNIVLLLSSITSTVFGFCESCAWLGEINSPLRAVRKDKKYRAQRFRKIPSLPKRFRGEFPWWAFKSPRVRLLFTPAYTLAWLYYIILFCVIPAMWHAESFLKTRQDDDDDVFLYKCLCARLSM